MNKHVSLILSAVALSNDPAQAAPAAKQLLTHVVESLAKQGEQVTSADQNKMVESASRWLSPNNQVRGSSLGGDRPTDPPLLF